MKRKRGLDFAKSGPLFERATFGVCSGDTLQNKVNAGDLWVRCTSGGADSRLQLKNKTKEEKMIKAIIFLETILTNFVKIDMMAITCLLYTSWNASYTEAPTISGSILYSA